MPCVLSWGVFYDSDFPGSTSHSSASEGLGWGHGVRVFVRVSQLASGAANPRTGAEHHRTGLLLPRTAVWWCFQSMLATLTATCKRILGAFILMHSRKKSIDFTLVGVYGYTDA